MHIVFWQNFPNHLQSALIRSLAGLSGIDVTLVVESGIPSWRETLGWLPPDFGRARLVINPTKLEQDSLLAGEPDHSVHIFSGLRSYDLVWEAFRRATHTDAHIGVYSEASRLSGLTGKCRWLRGWADARLYGRHIDFILAAGRLAEEWFARCGYPRRVVYPFGYFVEKPSGSNPDLDSPGPGTNPGVKLVYVGQCIRRKGVDILLKALAGMKSLDWQLAVVGDGAEAPKLVELCQYLGLSEQTSFVGALSNQQAMARLLTSDILVLPSRWDGWGAVVNEALMRGVPVVCSDRCGAAVLVSESRGSVVPAGSVAALRDALRECVLEGHRSLAARQRIRDWSVNIEGTAAADYVLRVIEHSRTGTARPQVPWLGEATGVGVAAGT